MNQCVDIRLLPIKSAMVAMLPDSLHYELNQSVCSFPIVPGIAAVRDAINPKGACVYIM
jgi:hypothetical protein